MQAHTEQLMTKQDFITLLEKMNSIEIMLKSQQSTPKKLVLTTAKEVAEHLGLDSIKKARILMKLPNFPKSKTPRVGKYNVGQWSADEVERFFRINKGKV